MNAAPKVFPNKAHQRAYENGIKAANEGRARFAPYGCDNRSARDFRKAWLAGYDGAIDRAAIAAQETDGFRK